MKRRIGPSGGGEPSAQFHWLRRRLSAQLVTSPVYGVMKREIRAREDSGWKRVEWELPEAPTLRELEVVHGRLIYLNPKVRPKTYPSEAHMADCTFPRCYRTCLNSNSSALSSAVSTLAACDQKAYASLSRVLLP